MSRSPERRPPDGTESSDQTWRGARATNAPDGSVLPGDESRTFSVAWSVLDDEWVATCNQFPSLSWLAESPGEALDGLLTLLIGL